MCSIVHQCSTADASATDLFAETLEAQGWAHSILA